MSIRKIIGYGLLAAFVGCQDQSSKEAKACVKHPLGLGLPPIFVKTIEKPQPRSESPVKTSNNCQQKHRWTSQKGQPHQTEQKVDENGIHHNIHRWRNANGDEHRTDQYVAKNNCAHSEHVWVDSKGDAHRTIHITRQDGKVEFIHQKKDKDGKVTIVKDDERRERSRSQRDRSRSRSQSRRQRERSVSRERDDKDDKDNNGRKGEVCEQGHRGNQGRNEEERQHDNEGLHLGQNRRENESKGHVHQQQGPRDNRGREQQKSRPEREQQHSNQGLHLGQNRNEGKSRQDRNQGHQHGNGYVPPQQGPQVVILPPPNCSNLRAH